MATINLTITDTPANLALAVATLDEYFGRTQGQTDTQLAQSWLDSLYAVLKAHGFTWGLTCPPAPSDFKANLVAAVQAIGFPKINGEDDSDFLRRYVIYHAKELERNYRRAAVAPDESGMT